MESPGVLRRSMWKFLESIKKDKNYICGISIMESWFLTLVMCAGISIKQKG